MTRYAYFIFSHAKKSKGLYISFFISLVATISVYIFSVISHNDTFKENLYRNGDSGLVSNFYLKMVLFILWSFTTIYFVTFVFKNSDKDGFDLQIISKKITRTQIQIAKFLVSMCFCLFWATINSIFLLIPLFIDEILTSNQKVEWFFSIYIGSLIIGLIITSLAAFVATIMNHTFSLIVSVLLVLFFPIFSIFMWFAQSPDSRSIEEKFGHGSLGIKYSKEGALSPKITINGNRATLNNVQTNSTFETIYAKPNPNIDSEISNYNRGNKFLSYSPNDVWNPFSNFLSMFMTPELSKDHSYKEFSKKATFQTNLMSELNSVKIGTGTYFYIPHSIDNDKIDFFTNPYMEVSGVTKDENYIEDLYNNLKVFLSANPAFVTYYQKLTFLEQCQLMERYINHFDSQVDQISDFFFIAASGQSTTVKTRVLEKDVKNQINGFIFANRLIKEDHNTYTPEHFGDETNKYDPFVNNIYHSYEVFYEISKRDYENKSTGTYIWPFIMIALSSASVLIYRKKDIK